MHNVFYGSGLEVMRDMSQEIQTHANTNIEAQLNGRGRQTRRGGDHHRKRPPQMTFERDGDVISLMQNDIDDHELLKRRPPWCMHEGTFFWEEKAMMEQEEKARQELAIFRLQACY